MARSMLSEYNMSHSFWAKAINMACYYSNRLNCHPMMEKTPYELLNGRKPNIAWYENLDNVKGTQLVNAMKNMDIGDIRPREVIDVEDDKNQVLSNSNMQASDSHDQVQASASDDKV